MHCTRPNIAFTIEVLSRITHNPAQVHWDAVLGLLKYFRGTMNYALSYKSFSNILEGYIESNWITNSMKLNSQVGESLL